MSYDLYFKSRRGEVAIEGLANYFRTRSNYQVEGSQAIYENEDTGVYFLFDLQAPDEGSEFPLGISLNFCRPSFFGREAEIEISAIVEAFDFSVSDPQAESSDLKHYSPEQFLSEWDRGNQFGCSTILGDPKNRQDVICFPTDRLMRVWKWNFGRSALQKVLGEGKFVPRIMFITLAGQPATAAVWPDGIPIAVPETDYFFVPRKELAPRRFLRRIEDRTIVASQAALSAMAPFIEMTEDGVPVVSYDAPPKAIRAFVEGLPIDSREIKVVAPDSAMDSELIWPILD